jgi:hypothetical protein
MRKPLYKRINNPQRIDQIFVQKVTLENGHAISSIQFSVPQKVKVFLLSEVEKDPKQN